MKALDFLKKLNNKGSNRTNFIPKENFLWHVLKENYGEYKVDCYLRPYRLDLAVGYYAKRTKKNFLVPVSEEEYNAIWESIRKEKKIHGKQTTQSPVIRFVYFAILPVELNEKIGEDTLVLVECSKTEFNRLIQLEEQTMNGNFGAYFKEVGKTPEEMNVVVRRFFNGDKVPNYEYVIKFGAKGVEPVIYEPDKSWEADLIDLERYYHPKSNNLDNVRDELQVEEVVG